MFKKFLVLCVMMCFTALWGEERCVAAEGVAEQEAVDEAKEYSKGDILKMMNLKSKLDYSYESHVDIPYDLYGDNKHVNRRLTKDEQAKYYADPLAYMENIAQNDWQRAFEMSMYYQGWKPNTIFFRFDFLMLNNDFNYIPSTDDMRFKTRKVLDQAKALHWAQIAYNLAEKQIEADEKSEKEFYLKLNWDNADIIKMNLLFRIDESDIDNKNEVFDKYSLSNELIKKDESAMEKHLRASDSFRHWRQYYCGFVYPKDNDFALLTLFLTTAYKEDMNYHKSLSLLKITSGLYDKNEYDEAAIKKWRTKFILANYLYIQGVFDFWDTKEYNFGNYIFPLSKYAIKDFVPYTMYYRDAFVFKNPYYDKAKALEELDKAIANYKPVRECNSKPRQGGTALSDFIMSAPYLGVELEVYNEFVAKIYQHHSSDFFKKEEEIARDFYNGRLPNPYDYR